MKIIKIFFLIVLSTTTVGSYPRYVPVYDWNIMYPQPTVELKYMSNYFTKELIIKESFRSTERVPIRIELVKPQMEDGHAKDLYLTIESVQVVFTVREDVVLRSDTYPGHLVLIPATWPDGFKLEQGSRMAFTIKYNYNLKNEIVEKGEIVEYIRF